MVGVPRDSFIGSHHICVYAQISGVFPKNVFTLFPYFWIKNSSSAINGVFDLHAFQYPPTCKSSPPGLALPNFWSYASFSKDLMG